MSNYFVDHVMTKIKLGMAKEKTKVCEGSNLIELSVARGIRKIFLFKGTRDLILPKKNKTGILKNSKMRSWSC